MKTYKICMLGDFAVGKTSLVRRFVEGRFDDRYLSTIGVKISRKFLERPDYRLNLIIWDLAGGEEFSGYDRSYLRGAAGAILVCDLTRPNTLQIIETYAQQMSLINPGSAMVVAGNKADLETERLVEDADLDRVCERVKTSYLLTSARLGDNVETCMELLADMIETRDDLAIS